MPDGNVGARWADAVFLGYDRSSNNYLLHTPEGIVKARSMKRLPLPNRWSHETLPSIKSTPWSEQQRATPGVRFQEPAAEPDEPVEPGPPVLVRRFRNNVVDLREHGFTDGCQQCSQIQRYGKARAGLQHTQVCRDRVVASLLTTPQGRARMEAHTERTDRYSAEHLEHADKQTAAEGSAEANTEQFLGRGDELHNDDSATRSARAPGDALRNADLAAAAPLHHHPTDAVISAPLLQPDDDIHTQITAGREEAEQKDSNDDTEMGNDGEDEEMGVVGFNDGSIGSLEPGAGDVARKLLLPQLGSLRSYRRDARAACKKIVSEIYTPPRVTKELRASQRNFKHLLPGFAFDLIVNDLEDGLPWGFSRRVKRERARKTFREQQPHMLIGSPACTAYSTWQAFSEAKSPDLEAVYAARRQAKVHMDFMISLYREQVEAGRYFLHEHPRHATSLRLRKMEDLMAVEVVEFVEGDQCQFGSAVRRGTQR